MSEITDDVTMDELLEGLDYGLSEETTTDKLLDAAADVVAEAVTGDGSSTGSGSSDAGSGNQSSTEEDLKLAAAITDEVMDEVKDPDGNVVENTEPETEAEDGYDEDGNRKEEPSEERDEDGNVADSVSQDEPKPDADGAEDELVKDEDGNPAEEKPEKDAKDEGGDDVEAEREGYTRPTGTETIEIKKKSDIELARQTSASDFSVVDPSRSEEENIAAIRKKNSTIGQKEAPSNGWGEIDTCKGNPYSTERSDYLEPELDEEGNTVMNGYNNPVRKSITSEELGGTISQSEKVDPYTMENLQHYEGELGSFDYDPTEFEITTITIGDNNDKTGLTTTQPVLHYIGNETDGNNIDIPEGVTNADYMFYGNDSLKSVPALPESLESAHCMFANCEALTKFSTSAKRDYHTGFDFWNYGKGGSIEMPPGLKDTSMMFMNCSNLTEGYDCAGDTLIDARGMYANCESMKNVMNCGRAFCLAPEFMTDMYYGTEMQGLIETGVDENGNPLYPNNNHSVFYTEEGEFLSEKLTTELGNNAELIDKVKEMQKERQGILAIAGYTGASVQTVETGYGTTSTTDMERRSVEEEKSGLFDGLFEGEAGEWLKKGIVGIGSFALLSKFTGSNLIGLGGAALLSGVGVSPLLNGVASVIGKDSQVGQVLTSLADKLEGFNGIVDWFGGSSSEKTEGYTADAVTSDVNDSLNSINAYLNTDGNLDIRNAMGLNGANAAKEGVFEKAAEQKEENLGAIGAFMDTSVVGIQDYTKGLLNENGELDEAGKTELANLYMGLFRGMDSYDDNALAQIGETYANDADAQQKSARGLGKVMRQMAAPMFDSLMEMEAQYGNILTDAQREELENMELTGVASFKDYEPGMDMRPLYDMDTADVEAEAGSTVPEEWLTDDTEKESSEYTPSYAETVSEDYDDLGLIGETSDKETSDTTQKSSEKSGASTSRGDEAEEKFGEIVAADEAGTSYDYDDYGTGYGY